MMYKVYKSSYSKRNSYLIIIRYSRGICKELLASELLVVLKNSEQERLMKESLFCRMWFLYEPTFQRNISLPYSG
jgi:hypothetical protein